jgi:nitrogen fixation NifU-like protein
MFDDLNDLYQQVIMDHSKSPRNYLKLEGANRVAEGRNPLCGDQVTVYSLIENGFVREITWQGSGCAISKASASIMTDALKGKSADEAKELFRNFHDLITTGASDSKDLKKLAAFGGVNKFPARVKCAILPWHAALATLDGNAAVVSTE